MIAQETMVRMGEQAWSASSDDVLVSIGLGSCIGLVLLDRAKGIAGLAHVMLPESPKAGAGADPGKFADTAVPALIADMVRAGARPVRIEAMLVGGAQMFSFGGGAMDVGARNAVGVREALKAARVPIRAEATGGSKGRTVRVHVGDQTVMVREAGAGAAEPLSPSLGRR